MAQRKRPSRLKILTTWLVGTSLFLLILGTIGLGGVYLAYSKSIPSDQAILNWQADEATRIYDRNGTILYEIFGEEKRVIIASDQISPHLKHATIAIEDARFYNHHGLDVKGVMRAAIANLRNRKSLEGGSTITQQLAKNAYLTSERTVTRKLKELLLAVKIERHYTKDQILTMYLNQVGYGGNAYGAEAAANMYFGRKAKDLTITEAATLASLTKAPSVLSPYNKNTERLLARRNIVLDRMVLLGYAKPEEAEKAKTEKLTVIAHRESITAPHFVMHVKQLLIDKYGEDMVNKGGLQVTTTLDPAKQTLAEQVAKEADPVLKKSAASNTGIVAINPKTGEVLAMAGSRDYFDTANDGNVNVMTSTRPPGSAFKPVVYATAFEKGPWAPGSTIFDLETNFGKFGLDKKDYIPKNYDLKFHGPVSIREALANSYNVPAVKMMALIGKEETLNAAKSVGITTLNDPNKYGLSLVIGGGDVQPLQLAGAYGSFANGGALHKPVTILKITQRDKTLLEYKPEPKQVFRPEVAYQISAILSDKETRKIVFGPGGPLEVKGRTVAVKTGTTQDYRDAWTIGYTPSLVVGVWVGNNDYRPMKQGSAGAMAAAPIWNSYISRALEGTPNEDFVPPSSLQMVEVDAVTGKLPTHATRQKRQDIFAPWQMPTEVQLASYKVFGCDGGIKEVRQSYLVQSEKPDDPGWQKPVLIWARAHGYPTGGLRDMRESCPTPPPQVVEEVPPPENVGGSEEHGPKPEETPPPAPPINLHPQIERTPTATTSDNPRRDRTRD